MSTSHGFLLLNFARSRRFVAALTCAAVAVLGLAVVTFVPITSARADTAPAAGSGLPTTVSADPLPTVQINGVVWSEVTVGNTVYAAGEFTQARPAGSPAGTNETPRGGLVAFDITTGTMLPWNHTLNAAGRQIIVSPDKSTLYVVGDFTTVDGLPRGHVAAFDVASGALKTTFAPTLSSTALAVTATNTTVYAGGGFTTANGAAVNRVASFSAADGSLNAGWAASADNGNVTAMLMVPDQSVVLIAGRFTTMDNGGARFGIGGVDPTTGALTPWNANFPIKDASVNASITSLKTDGTSIYGSGYTFTLGGNFEGTFSIDKTGNIVWLNSCHGDTYDVTPLGGVLYSASHAHDCSDIGAWEETTPRLWHRALASTSYAAPGCTLAHNNNPPYTDYAGLPCAKLLDWNPDFAAGTYTGATQGPWATSGNSQYVTMGGEFPTVNGIDQYGLVRFAVPSIAPLKVAPIAAVTLIPNVLSQAPGSARISWKSTWDRDNENLTYNLYRNNGTTPIYTITSASTFWNMPNLGFVDTGQTPGVLAQYRLTVSDPNGNTITLGKSVAIPLDGSANSADPYYKDVTTDGANNYWRLDEASGTNAVNSASNNDMVTAATVTRATAGALAGSSDTASTFDGTATGFASSQTLTQAPDVYSTELWFKTTSTQGGKLIGYGSANTGTSANNFDRQVYLDNAGHLLYGVNTNASTILSAGTYNDGLWHQVVATLSPAGMVLYADGRVIGRNAAVSTGLAYTGYWRVGGDNLTGWKNTPSSNFIAASIDEVATYPTALDLNQVQQHYTDSGRTLTGTVAPTDAFGKVIYGDAPDIYFRLDESAGTSASDASGNNRTGTYYNGVTFGTPSPVSTGFGTATTFNGSNATLSNNTSLTSPTVFTEEAWFKTTTTSGGKIIGFQASPSGTTGTFDRHVYMINSGQLVFGTQTSTNVANRTTITSASSYNDGKWHQVAATMSSAGMNLYVDGAVVGTSPQATAQSYTGGYWRIGGGSTWAGTSGFFAGAIDEAAVYGYALSPAQISRHWSTSGVSNKPPVASFTSTVANLAVSFDGTGSSDPDGPIANYAWTFGDGTTGTGATVSHTYATAGTYTVALTVTDGSGATNTRTIAVATNQPPTASFTTLRANLAVSVDATASTDTDGTIAAYAWDFGDGGTGTGVRTSHTYASAGSYVIALTVTDNSGATNTTLKTVSVSINQLPTASFVSSSTNGATTAFDASASSDADGTIVGYTWTFGDGTSGTGVTVSHTYVTPGSYTVALTVTDNSDGSNTVTRTVIATAIATDDFGRTVATGWGNADIGGAWTVSSAAVFAVTGGAGTMSLAAAGTSRNAYLNSVASSDTDVRITVAADKLATGGSTYITLSGRKVAGQGEYRAKVQLMASGGITIQLLRSNSAGTESTVGSAVTVAGLTYAAGTVLQIRMQVVGTTTTTLKAKVWNNALAEPANWSVSNSDATAGMQAPGAVGVIGYISSTTTNAPVKLTFDALRVTTTQAAGANPTPVAAFTSTMSNLTVSADASGSTDPNGSIASYTWNFGDGTSATGVTTTHTYASPGTYVLTLTVADVSGATNTVSYTQTTNQPPVAAFTLAQSYLAVTANASGSADPDGSIAGYTWDFGDGSTGTGASVAHTYAAAGSYVITLTVIDNAGATSTAVQTVAVVANRPPVAVLSVSQNQLSVTADASGSSDPDGTITGYAWDFGDGSTATGVTAAHSYTASGSYVITLTVTDNGGLSSTATATVQANQAPVAAFTTAQSLLVVSADASGSSDPDGTIASYAWDFGDGTNDTGVTTTHTYDSSGSYLITLVVTDNQGATTIKTKTVTVVGNQPPVANFTASVANLTVSTDATASGDPDGTIVSYAWNFGDGTTATGVSASHTYATAGTYSIVLTVTDDGGATGSSAQSVATNQPPVASFTTTQNNLALSTNAAGSSDSDGTISTYAWDFGDASTATGVTAAHTYAAAGSYTVTLVVTDNAGATNTITKSVTMAINQAPIAAFTSSVSGATASFNGSGSSDPDGTVAAYNWNFGDSSTGTGVTSAHTYTASGTYTVVLTVTDNAGATTSISHPVTVVVATVTVLASDDFGRTSATGWGTADSGGVWTVNTAANFAVAGGVGTINQPAGATNSAYLNSVSSTDTDVRLTFADNKLPTGGGTYVTLSGRKVTGQGEYRAKVQLVAGGAVKIQLIRSNSAGTETAIGSVVTVAGLTYTAGMVLQLRLQATGTSPTTINARVWNNASTEPTTWAVSITDATVGLQAAGAIGLLSYASSSTTNAPQTISFDALRATTTATAVPNVPPVAAFTSTVTGAVVAFDGTGSTDSDGTIASYAWNYGDATSGTGATSSHTYPTAGTYTVTLTVTDNSGATNAITHTVTTTVNGLAVLAADAFGRTLSGGWGSADTGGAWTVSTPANFAVTGGVGAMTLPAAGNSRTAYLNSVSSTDTDARISFAVDKAATGGGTYVTLVGRRVTGQGDYRAKVQLVAGGAVKVQLLRANSAGVETAIGAVVTVSGLTYTPGAVMQVRLQVWGTGTTNFRVKVWSAQSTEPTAWQVAATDTTAGLQVAGGLGVIGYISSSTTSAPDVVSFDGLNVTTTGN